MLCGLIMAGGKGTRFWPLSTEEKPKQFLNLLGDHTMLQMTVRRLERLIPINRIFVVTAEKYVNLVKEQLPDLPKRNVILEPVGKNTAPCIALSAFIIESYYGNASLAVIPSDHLINDEDRFIETLKTADEFVNINDDAIVTLGIKPNRPETEYGYIKFNHAKCKFNDFSINKVERFFEKPSEEKAQLFLNEGTYLWNSGIFVWKISTIKKYTKLFLLETYITVDEIAAAIDTENFKDILNTKYSIIESISVDYGIMERVDNIYVIPSDFGWDDVGSWTSIERYHNKDNNDNICMGNVKCFDSKKNIIIGNEKQIVVIGIKDTFVITTEGIIYIVNKDKVGEIRKFKNQI